MDHSSGRVALFNITGFVTDCCLTVDGVQSSRAGPRCSMQSITVTGLNDTVFRDAVNAANLVSDFMLGAGPHITPLPSVVTLGGLCGGITAMARVMTPAEHNIFEVVDIPAQLDVEGYAKNWVNGGDGNQRFVYTADNDIEVMNLIGLENDSECFWRCSPTTLFFIATAAAPTSPSNPNPSVKMQKSHNPVHLGARGVFVWRDARGERGFRERGNSKKRVDSLEVVAEDGEGRDEMVDGRAVESWDAPATGEDATDGLDAGRGGRWRCRPSGLRRRWIGAMLA
ncbi:hypothetical protein B0H14DRAFT_3567228 [Mycena olivaceomarginata]|nr:hypothetical protein B0H14DRAFT_3567228 [Mycena olivaceomarginata]